MINASIDTLMTQLKVDYLPLGNVNFQRVDGVIYFDLDFRDWDLPAILEEIARLCEQQAR